MNPERGLRWSDARLDDKFETITGELTALRKLPERLADVAAEVRNLRRDVDHCFTSLREHRDDFSTYVEEQDKTHEAHRLERKSDRRWMVGTVLTSAALVIAAMGLLVGHLG